jgi:uncharacterized phiE125 gp8 family phage protein
MGLSIVTAPSEYPVTLTEAKDYLRVDSSDFDDEIELIIAAETAYAEIFTGCKFVPQTWDVYLDAFPTETERQVISLPFSTVIGVDGVFYQDRSGGDQEMDAGLYVVDRAGRPARIGLALSATWPQTSGNINAVRIRVTTGDQDATVSPAVADVPSDVKLAILFRIKASFDGGDEAGRLMEIAEMYLKKHRVVVSLA